MANQNLPYTSISVNSFGNMAGLTSLYFWKFQWKCDGPWRVPWFVHRAAQGNVLTRRPQECANNVITLAPVFPIITNYRYRYLREGCGTARLAAERLLSTLPRSGSHIHCRGAASTAGLTPSHHGGMCMAETFGCVACSTYNFPFR